VEQFDLGFVFYRPVQKDISLFGQNRNSIIQNINGSSGILDHPIGKEKPAITINTAKPMADKKRSY
jgi:hypothetical protein